MRQTDVTELLVNCRNGQRQERTVPGTVAEEPPAHLAAIRLRREAMERLQARAARDEVVADLLTVLGLVP